TRSSSSPVRPRRAGARSHDLHLPRVAATEVGRGMDAAHDHLVAGRTVDKADIGVGGETPADTRAAHGIDEWAPVAACELETGFAEARERGRTRRHPDGVRAAHAAALASCCGARSANFAKRLRKASFSVPTGPLRCFARITSARP